MSEQENSSQQQKVNSEHQIPPRAEKPPKLETTVETSKGLRVRFADHKTVKTSK